MKLLRIKGLMEYLSQRPEEKTEFESNFWANQLLRHSEFGALVQTEAEKSRFKRKINPEELMEIAVALKPFVKKRIHEFGRNPNFKRHPTDVLTRDIEMRMPRLLRQFPKRNRKLRTISLENLLEDEGEEKHKDSQDWMHHVENDRNTVQRHFNRAGEDEHPGLEPLNEKMVRDFLDQSGLSPLERMALEHVHEIGGAEKLTYKQIATAYNKRFNPEKPVEGKSVDNAAERAKIKLGLQLKSDTMADILQRRFEAAAWLKKNGSLYRKYHDLGFSRDETLAVDMIQTMGFSRDAAAHHLQISRWRFDRLMANVLDKIHAKVLKPL